MRISDWSSDVCSSDLQARELLAEGEYYGPSRWQQKVAIFLQSNQSVPADKGRPAPVAVVMPDDWQDKLLAEMERRFRLSEQRSEERRGGKECVSRGRSRWSADY